MSPVHQAPVGPLTNIRARSTAAQPSIKCARNVASRFGLLRGSKVATFPGLRRPKLWPCNPVRATSSGVPDGGTNLPPHHPPPQHPDETGLPHEPASSSEAALQPEADLEPGAQGRQPQGRRAETAAVPAPSALPSPFPGTPTAAFTAGSADVIPAGASSPPFSAPTSPLQQQQLLLLAQAQAQTQGTTLRAQLVESQRKAALLEAMVGALRERLKREEERNAALAAEMAAGRVELAQSETQRRELEKRIGGLRAELADTQGKLNAAQRRAADLEARVGQLAKQNAALVLRVGMLEEDMQTQAEAAGRAAEAARERIRALEAAAGEDQLQISRMQVKLAEREAELAVLQRGEAELQEALQQSKVAAEQMAELMRGREAEIVRLRSSLKDADERGEAEANDMRQKLAALEGSREEEVGRLRSQLMECTQQAASLREAAAAKAEEQKAQVEELRKELQAAKIRSEQASARRVAEVSELRSALEQQLGAAQQEALEARGQLAAVKSQLDGVLSPEFLELLEEDLRRSVLPAPSSSPASAPRSSPSSPSSASSAPFAPFAPTPGGPVSSRRASENQQALTSLDTREASLRRQLEALQGELADLQAAAVARLGPALVARAQELESSVGRFRQLLAARRAAQDEAGAQRASQQLEALSSELGSLYRLVMLPETRTRERAVRAELQNRELELRGLLEQRAQLIEQQEQARKEAQKASTPTAMQLRRAVQARVKELLQEREKQLQAQAAAREQQLQAQLQARLSESQQSQQRELRAVQDAVAQQVKVMESSWRGQLDSFMRSLQETSAEKEKLAAQAAAAEGLVRQQVAELETLRRELSAAQAAVAALRRAVEGSKAAAAQQSAGAVQEVQKLTAQVAVLQSTLNERERLYATAQPAAAPPSKSIASPPQPQQPPLQLRAGPFRQEPLVPPEGGNGKVPHGHGQQGQQAQHGQQAQQGQHEGVTAWQAGAAAKLSRPASGGRAAPPASPHTPSPSPGPSPAPASSCPLDPQGNESFNSHAPEEETVVESLTPLRPGWPSQYGGTPHLTLPGPRPPSPSRSSSSAPPSSPSPPSPSPPSLGLSGELSPLTARPPASGAATNPRRDSTPATTTTKAIQSANGVADGTASKARPAEGHDARHQEEKGAAPEPAASVPPLPAKDAAAAPLPHATSPSSVPPTAASDAANPRAVRYDDKEAGGVAGLSTKGDSAASDSSGNDAETVSVLSVWSRILLPPPPTPLPPHPQPLLMLPAPLPSPPPGPLHAVPENSAAGGAPPTVAAEAVSDEAAANALIVAVSGAPGDESKSTTAFTVLDDSAAGVLQAAAVSPPRNPVTTEPGNTTASSAADSKLEGPGSMRVETADLPAPERRSEQPPAATVPTAPVPIPARPASPARTASGVQPQEQPLSPSRQGVAGQPTAALRQPTAPRAPTPAEAAMAAAAGAAAAAKRAAAVEPSAREKPRSFTAPPISEWGRPKPSDTDIPDLTTPSAGPGSEARPASPAQSAPSPTSTSPAGGPRPSNVSGSLFSSATSDAELGAEIAAIAQSLVQRTIGGAVAGALGVPAAATGAGSPAVGTAGGSAAGAELMPPGENVAVKAPGFGSGGEAATAGTVSNDRQVALVVAAYAMAQPGKRENATEDAFFVLTPAAGAAVNGVASAAGPLSPDTLSAVGVADGVGGWAEANVDPGQYSREIMAAVARAAAEARGPADPRELLAEAQASVRVIGSCTACVAVLSTSPGGGRGGSSSGPNTLLSIANLGDSGVRVVRRGSLVLATSAQEHQFNMPYQMAHPDNLPETDTAADAQIYQITVRPGDVIVLASDGLFDNMWDEELVGLVSASAAAVSPALSGPAALAAAQPAAQQLAASLVTTAFRHAQDPAFRSPWAVEMANQPAASWLARLFPRGGRVDDITVVVAMVVPAA